MSESQPMTDATAPVHVHAEQLRNHWWWRPGWGVGRRFFTWHLTFEHEPQLHALVDAYQHELAELPGLDLIPREWLHLTMQGLGFVDEIEPDQVEALVDAARARLAALPAPSVMFEQALIRPEAIVLPAAPADRIGAIRDAIREAFSDAGLGDAPERQAGFLPHVSVAYVNQDGPAASVADALSEVAAEPATVTVRAASLIVLDRDSRMYRWRERAIVPLRAHAAA
jgi:2'-5' RNA ligase